MTKTKTMKKTKTNSQKNRTLNRTAVLLIIAVGLLFCGVAVWAATTLSNNGAASQTVTADEADFLVMDFNIVVGSDSTLGGVTPTGGDATVDDVDGDWDTIYHYDPVGGGTWAAGTDALWVDDGNKYYDATETSIAGITGENTGPGISATGTPDPANWNIEVHDADDDAGQYTDADDCIVVDDDADDVYTTDADATVHDGTDNPSATDVLSNDWATGTATRYADNNNDGLYTDGEAILISADASLTAGVLSGAGTDDVITAGTAAIIDFDTGQYKFADHDNNGTYTDGEAIIYEATADANLEETDTVVTSGNATLTAFDGAEAGLNIYADTTDDNVYTNGEAILVQVHNGADNYADTNAIQALAADELSYYDDHTGTDGDYDDGEAIINDVDNDGFPSANDLVKTAGKAKVEALTATDSVCFDASVVSDSEFDPNEVIWWDAGGDCSSFDTGVDVILVGAAPGAGSTEFGTEQEVAFLDEDNNSSYTCSYGGTCEPIIYSGVDATDLADDADLPTTTVFYDSSTERRQMALQQ